jgi:hypothetical protein
MADAQGRPRHPAGNRAALEAVLQDWLPLVADWCSTRNVALSAWPQHPEIARVMQSVAWDRLTDQHIAGGMSRDAAERNAAEQLGLEVETLRSRKNRAKNHAAHRSICT